MLLGPWKRQDGGLVNGRELLFWKTEQTTLQPDAVVVNSFKLISTRYSWNQPQPVTYEQMKNDGPTTTSVKWSNDSYIWTHDNTGYFKTYLRYIWMHLFKEAQCNQFLENTLKFHPVEMNNVHSDNKHRKGKEGRSLMQTSDRKCQANECFQKE